MSDFPERNQENMELAESVNHRIELLVDRGWDSEDASRYVELHHVWLHDDLMAGERQQMEELERKYSVPPDFRVFEDAPPKR